MKTRDPLNPGDAAFDKFDEQIRRALMEEGAIVPETIEEVRQAKARLKKHPVTLPPHLRSPAAILSKEQTAERESKIVVLATARSGSESTKTEHHYRKAPEEFVEAVLIAQFTREMSNPEFPLGHLRQNKLVYFAHRKADEDVAEHFLKKAAGPYSPWATYKGPEGIAQKNGYVRRAKVGNRVGFLIGDNIGKIDQYVSRYPVCAAVDWVVSHFRRVRNEDLELFATVDFAALDLVKQDTPITMENVKRIIAENREWQAKLQRETFSDANITRALSELRTLFPATYV